MDFIYFRAVARGLVVAGLLLYPSLIAEEPFGARVNTPPAAGLSKPVARNLAPRAKLRAFDDLDHAAFLREFERQADHGLLACLKSSGSVRGEIAFLARLGKRGELSAVQVIFPSELQLDCVFLAVKQMKFTKVAAELEDSVEIRWRFIW